MRRPPRGFTSYAAYALWHAAVFASMNLLYWPAVIPGLAGTVPPAAGVLVAGIGITLAAGIECTQGYGFEEAREGGFHTGLAVACQMPAVCFRLILLTMGTPDGTLFWTRTLAVLGVLAWQTCCIVMDRL